MVAEPAFVKVDAVGTKCVEENTRGWGSLLGWRLALFQVSFQALYQRGELLAVSFLLVR
jgi:hypothetical protein